MKISLLPRFSWTEPVEIRRRHHMDMILEKKTRRVVQIILMLVVVFLGLIVSEMGDTLGIDMSARIKMGGILAFILLFSSFIAPAIRWRLPAKVRVYDNRIQSVSYPGKPVLFKEVQAFYIEDEGHANVLYFVFDDGQKQAYYGVKDNVNLTSLSDFFKERGLQQLN